MSSKNRSLITVAWDYVRGFANRWGGAWHNQYTGNERAQQQLRRK